MACNKLFPSNRNICVTVTNLTKDPGVTGVSPNDNFLKCHTCTLQWLMIYKTGCSEGTLGS